MFKVNPEFIKHGNHISDVDAQYCTQCGADTAHPIFDGECTNKRRGRQTTCPHIVAEPNTEWKVGEACVSATDDGSLGVAVIIALCWHKEERYATISYAKFDKTPMPCFRTHPTRKLRRPTPAPVDRSASKINTLTFQALRIANRMRVPLFKNATGETIHSGQDWTVSDWALAVAGETGELAEVLLEYALMTMSLGKAENIMKKLRRKDFNVVSAKSDLSNELADVQIYLDMLADSLGIDLGAAVIAKWNQKSEDLDISLRLTETGCERTDIENV